MKAVAGFAELRAERRKGLDVAGGEAKGELLAVPELPAKDVDVRGDAGALGCGGEHDDVLGVVSDIYKEAANGGFCRS